MATKFLANINLSQNELQNARVQNLTTTQINAISAPVEGQIAYDTTLDVLKYYNGTAWTALSSGAGTVTAVTGTGAISSTGGTTPAISIADATTSVKGAVQLSDSTSTTSSILAATPTAVKAAYDAAAAKVASVTAGSARVTIGGTATAPTVDVAAATTSVAGIVALSDSTSTTSSVLAATPTAVKAAYDLAAGKANTSDKLSVFAATTSAELAGVISDETGTGALVFANTPTLVTPNIGVATGTSLVLSGDLTVNGTTTTVNSTTVTVDDKNLELGSVASPTDAGADGGGITLKGTTDKTISWVDATDAWTLSEHADLAAAKEYKIAGASVLSASTLGSGVTGSSLTSVGTIATGVWNGTDIAVADGGTGSGTAAGAKTNLGFMTRYAVTATWTAGENKTITHALGTKDVTFSVYDSSDNYVIADVVTATTNTITVMCSVAGDYRVVVIG